MSFNIKIELQHTVHSRGEIFRGKTPITSKAQLKKIYYNIHKPRCSDQAIQPIQKKQSKLQSSLKVTGWFQEIETGT